MENKISSILKQHSDVESFKTALYGKGSEFEFDTDSMVEFGETYCSLYPESLTHSDSAGVVTGYRLVRVCIIERMLSIIPEDLREIYREMFSDVTIINSSIDEVKALIGADEALKIHDSLDSLVKKIKTHIDCMPHGVPKERFVGGISVFFNIFYLMKKRLES